MSTTTKNTVFLVILVAAASSLVWRWIKPDEDAKLTIAPESRTIWVCEGCGHWGELTARELSDARREAQLARMKTQKAQVTSVRQTVLKCPKCGELQMHLGLKCTSCGKGIVGSDSDLCPDCAKAAPKGATKRRTP
ncbi:MAG: hypothetical protein FLDDKLPJ_01387 [Phycisphaerae bacterium]|nr:hypothetical protein [Phycisphaerae bacterium]